MVAAVKLRDEWESQAWNRAITEGSPAIDPVKRLLALWTVLDLWFNDPDFRGCMFMNTAAEFPNPNDPVHQAAAAHGKKSRDHWRNLARQAGALTPMSAPETFADCFAALIQGALILRQTYGRNDAARAVRPAVEQLMRAYIPSCRNIAR